MFVNAWCIIFEFRRSSFTSIWMNARRSLWLRFFFDWCLAHTRYALILTESIIYSIIRMIHLNFWERAIVRLARSWFARFTWLIWRLYCTAMTNCSIVTLRVSSRKEISVIWRVFRNACSLICEEYAVISNVITWSRWASRQTKQLIMSFTTRCNHCFNVNCDFLLAAIIFNFEDISNALTRTISQTSILRINRALTRWESMKRLFKKQTKWRWRISCVTRSQNV